MGDFGGDSNLDGVIVRVSRRFNLFWILRDQATSWDHLEATKNVRNVKKTPR